MITFRSEEALNPWRLCISRIRTTFEITQQNAVYYKIILFSHVHLWNCKKMFKHSSLINSGFLDGTSPLCSNWNKECSSVPACCKIYKMTSLGTLLYFVGVGRGAGNLALEDRAEVLQNWKRHYIKDQIWKNAPKLMDMYYGYNKENKGLHKWGTKQRAMQ